MTSRERNCLLRRGLHANILIRCGLSPTPQREKWDAQLRARLGQEGRKWFWCRAQRRELTCPGMRRMETETVGEMFDAVMDSVEQCDFIIKAAAVGDYAPVHAETEKIKKSSETVCLRLEKNPRYS